jgi:hypothetical protein
MGVVPGLLEQAIDAHGGLEAFERKPQIRVHARSGGFALRSKRGTPGALADYEATIDARRPRTVIEGYPAPARRGIFEPDRVWVESHEGEVLAERHDPRARIRSPRRLLWWDHLDLLHFAGYALWNYFCTPFLFARPGFEVRELDERRLNVTFPSDIPTHSREQTFYFNEDGLLTRLDYTAEVFGQWAKGAHLCGEHRPYDGIVFPTRRRVYPRRRDGRTRPRPTLVWIDVDSVSRA